MHTIVPGCNGKTSATFFRVYQIGHTYCHTLISLSSVWGNEFLPKPEFSTRMLGHITMICTETNTSKVFQFPLLLQFAIFFTSINPNLRQICLFPHTRAALSE